MFSISKRVVFPAFVVWILISLFAACQALPGQVDSAPESSSGRKSDQTASAQEVSVGPARQHCYGPFPRMCLVVDGRQFYHEIKGFTHEPGYEYVLRIEEYDAYPGQEVIPQDSPGRYGYRLVEEVSKVKAAGEIIEAKVAPTRVTCPKSDELCLLVDGVPQGGAIAGLRLRI